MRVTGENLSADNLKLMGGNTVIAWTSITDTSATGSVDPYEYDDVKLMLNGEQYGGVIVGGGG